MSENRVEIHSGFQGKTYVWVKSGDPVEVSMTCGGKPFEDTKKCVDCLGETNNGIDCIRDLLKNEIVKEVVGENKGMKFIDAIQKYDKITKSGHKVFYMHKVSQEVFEYNTETGVGTLITADIRLLTSEGWQEYKEDKLILPKRFDYPGVKYYTVSTINNVYADVDQHAGIDTERFNTYNYFIDRDLAQYVADKQLIQRIELVLHELNISKFNFVTRLNLIGDYIRDNFKDVLDRINEYESKSRV